MQTVFILIDDSEHDLLLSRKSFQQSTFAYDVHLSTMSSAQEAMAYLTGKDSYSDRVKFPLPMAILVELSLTGVSGFGFLRWLRGFHAAYFNLVPVIVATGTESEQEIAEAKEMGANAVLPKPIDWAKVGEVLRSTRVD